MGKEGKGNGVKVSSGNSHYLESTHCGLGTVPDTLYHSL